MSRGQVRRLAQDYPPAEWRDPKRKHAVLWGDVNVARHLVGAARPILDVHPRQPVGGIEDTDASVEAPDQTTFLLDHVAARFAQVEVVESRNPVFAFGSGAERDSAGPEALLPAALFRLCGDTG